MRPCPQVQEILPHAGRGLAASRRIDKQGRERGEMFGPRLDGIDPAPLALVEVGRCQQIADGKNSGQRGADLMRKRGERRLDHAGPGRLYRTLRDALARLASGSTWSALFWRPPFR